MDERIESFLADVLALEGEDENSTGRSRGSHRLRTNLPGAGSE
jgi:hypothetical protein